MGCNIAAPKRTERSGDQPWSEKQCRRISTADGMAFGPRCPGIYEQHATAQVGEQKDQKARPSSKHPSRVILLCLWLACAMLADLLVVRSVLGVLEWHLQGKCQAPASRKIGTISMRKQTIERVRAAAALKQHVSGWPALDGSCRRSSAMAAVGCHGCHAGVSKLLHQAFCVDTGTTRNSQLLETHLNFWPMALEAMLRSADPGSSMP